MQSTRKTRTFGNSSAAIVGILALVILAGAAWFVFAGPSNDTTIIKKEEHHHEDGHPDVDIKLPGIEIKSDDDK